MTGTPLGLEAEVKEATAVGGVTFRSAKKPKQKKSVKVVKKNKMLPKEAALIPFSALGIQSDAVETGFKKLGIVEEAPEPKKAIRRSALEIKKAEEADENRQSDQEKEWEIPAFMRLKK